MEKKCLKKIASLLTFLLKVNNDASLLTFLLKVNNDQIFFKLFFTIASGSPHLPDHLCTFEAPVEPL